MNIKAIEKILKNRIFVIFILSAIIGVLFYIAIYGIDIINPKNIEWIYRRGADTISHYVGWCYYRNTPWSLSIGKIEGMIYPFSTSIVYTDSIPILAIFFKIFTKVLPDQFQYFGIWGLICFAMQGGLAGIILKK